MKNPLLKALCVVRKKMTKSEGMTMLELLIVIAIIGILSGVAFVSVQSYQRSMALLERDNIAKEIFVAAQNHLTAAKGGGYLESDTIDFGQAESSGEKGVGTNSEEVYYFVGPNAAAGGKEPISDLMLPFGSIDETVRSGGSYIVRYQKATGNVLDVFYCSAENSQYGHKLTSSDYETLKSNYTQDIHKQDRKKVVIGDESFVVGWYGGAAAENLSSMKLKEPSIEVYNNERLIVKVTDSNTDVDPYDYLLKLIVTGVTSGYQKGIVLKADLKDGKSSESVYTEPENSKASRLVTKTDSYEFILDDITTANMHFAHLDAGFIPGENIKLQVSAYSLTKRANIANSNEVTTNSLFANVEDTILGSGSTDGIPDTASISNIRHLENLDGAISSLHTTGSAGKLQIVVAKQISDLDWDDFCQKINSTQVTTTTPTAETDTTNGSGETTTPSPTASPSPAATPAAVSGGSSVAIYVGNTETFTGGFYPIAPIYNLTYDGANHSINNIKVSNRDYAGVFGQLSKPIIIKDLELADCSISGNISAGTLAGSLSNNSIVTNVLARYSSKDSGGNINAKVEVSGDSGTAGGLIGVINGGIVQFSAASVLVGAGTNRPAMAGGLIGSATAGTIISNCYSGGITDNGEYYAHNSGKRTDPIYSVNGVTVGGLVGSFSGTSIDKSYSTCAVNGTGDSGCAGGFIGSYSNGTITNCYSTGLVSGKTQFAFIGSGKLSSGSGNYYYRAINKVPKTGEGAKEGETELMLPFSEYVQATQKGIINALDADADIFDTFIGSAAGWSEALPYDAKLQEYYGGKYYLKSIKEMNNQTLPAIDANNDTHADYLSWDNLYVSRHYGDWPSAELFVFNN